MRFSLQLYNIAEKIAVKCRMQDRDDTAPYVDVESAILTLAA